MRFALSPALTLVIALCAAHASAQPAPSAPPASAPPPAPSAPPAYAPPPVYLPPPVYQEPRPRDIVVAYSKGLRFGISPGFMFAPKSGEIGFSIAGDVRYGFDLGALVLAPGARVAGYFPAHQTIVMGLATLRLTFPVGPVGPFVVGGAGPGWVEDPSQVGVAYLGGAGFMVHIGTRFGVGAEVSYQAIVGTWFDALFFGPLFLLSF